MLNWRWILFENVTLFSFVVNLVTAILFGTVTIETALELLFQW